MSGEPGNVTVSRIYLGQFRSLAPRCDVATLCQNWHAAVSASPRTPPTSFSVQVWSVTHPCGKITSTINPRCLPSSPSALQLMCWHGPQRGKYKISWVIAPLLCPEAWHRAETSGFGNPPPPHPFLAQAVFHAGSCNATRRVWSSKWSLPRGGRFLHVAVQVYLWTCWNLRLAWLTFYRHAIDINLK